MFKTKIKDLLEDTGSLDFDQIKRLIGDYDIISFDIYDTLIKRNVQSPTDVFELISIKQNLDDFKSERVNAEKRARQNSLGNEVTLDEIYNSFPSIYSRHLEACKNEELRLEQILSLPNKDILSLFEYAKSNKEVIIVTDMYLDRVTIEKVLNSNGICGYNALYISNELHLSKNDGSLFKYIKKIYQNKKILHIGNSFKSDWFKARVNGLSAKKIPTNIKKSLVSSTAFNRELNRNIKYKALSSFINNNIDVSKSYYYNFGYECFGPLLYGFVHWIVDFVKNNQLKNLYFCSRDGYIVQEAFKIMGFESIIKYSYLEVSRRSLRVPTLRKKISIEHLYEKMNLFSLTSMEEIFENIGLNIEDYHAQLIEYEFSSKKLYNSKLLFNDNNFKKLINEIGIDIQRNALIEYNNMTGYLSQFDFNSSAIIDIGWGGSIQKYLMESLEDIGKDSDIIGLYVGIGQRAKKLFLNKSCVYGYIFDCYNNEKDVENQRAFVGLFESLFLEHSGSVKKYINSNNGFKAIRYPNEFEREDLKKDEYLIKDIQEGALKFVCDFANNEVSVLVGYDPEVMKENLYSVGYKPSLRDVSKLGRIHFFNNGKSVMLANPNNLFRYIVSPRRFVKDLFESQWKIGFLKGLFKFGGFYDKVFSILNKIRNSRHNI